MTNADRRPSSRTRFCALMVAPVLGLSGCAGHAAAAHAVEPSVGGEAAVAVTVGGRRSGEPIVARPITGALPLGSTAITAPTDGFESSLTSDDLTAVNPDRTLQRYLQQSEHVDWYVGTLFDESYEPSNGRTVLYAFFPDVTCAPSRPAPTSPDAQTSVVSVRCPSALVFDAGSGAIMHEINGAWDPASASPSGVGHR